MYLKSVYMHGFKSFAEPVTIEFHKGITCIVGPNGSGKSNISDAIRWVLGEQSPRMLRGGKMEEVIFAGTKSRKSRGMAEVTINIDNSDHCLKTSYNEVAITRRMYRSGDSEYRINNNQCRLRDIRELIMDTGIGVDGYSLIGQGKISDIISNKTESRREIFEEAAGIVLYRTKKEAAQRKLISAEDNLDRINDIIGEIERRIDNLREDSEKAEEYLKHTERLKDLEINITLRNIESNEKKLDSLKEEFSETGQAIKKTSEEIEEIRESIVCNRDESANLDIKKNEKDSDLLAIVEEIKDAVNRKQLAEEKLSSIEKNMSRLTAEIKQLEKEIEIERKNASELAERKQIVDQNAAGFAEKLDETAAKQEILDCRAKEIASEISVLRDSIADEEKNITDGKLELERARNEKYSLELRLMQIDEEKSGKEDISKELLDRLNIMKREFRDLSMSLEKTKAAESEYKEKLKKKYDEKKEVTKRLETSKIEIGRQISRMKTIEEMENNYEGYNNAVRSIMKSSLSGIEGVVAELMKVPAGMETAIETALGGAIQNIVCSSDEAARHAIGLLKKSKAGRLTFLPMNTIKPISVTDGEVSSAPGFLGYGTECIETDNKYESIFEYLLGRTAVFDSLESAMAAFRKNARGMKFVTLEGETINAGGALTGGKYRNKTANILERKAEIEELKGKIKQTQKKIDSDAQYILTLDSVINECEKNISKLSEDIHSIDIKKYSCGKLIDEAENALSENREEDSLQEKNITDIKSGIEAAENKIRIAEKNISQAENNDLNLKNALDKKLYCESELKKEIEINSEAITQIKISEGAAKTEKEGIDAIFERVNSTLETMISSVSDKKNEMDVLALEKNTFHDEQGIDSFSISEKEVAKIELQNEIEQILQKKRKINEKLSLEEKQLALTEDELKHQQDIKYNIDVKKTKYETQLENMKNKLWEEYEISYIQALGMRKDNFVMSAAQKESRTLKTKIKELGNVNVGAIREYKEVNERYGFLTEQRNDVLNSRQELLDIISDMDQIIKKRFKSSFDEVSGHFEKTFTELFGGGNASLILENENDPLESSIEIVAQPPGKALKNINLLSGGEKSMTAIALMFSVLKSKPAPFCILDEIEAALDDSNIERFVKYLKSSFGDIQFALVTHKKTTMEQSDVMYGVTMPEHGVSKIFSLKMGEEFDGLEN